MFRKKVLKKYNRNKAFNDFAYDESYNKDYILDRLSYDVELIERNENILNKDIVKGLYCDLISIFNRYNIIFNSKLKSKIKKLNKILIKNLYNDNIDAKTSKKCYTLLLILIELIRKVENYDWLN